MAADIMAEMRTKTIEVPGVGEVTLVKNPRARRYSISITAALKVRVNIPWLGTYLAGERLARSNSGLIAQRIEAMRTRVEAKHDSPENAGIAELSPEQRAALVGQLRRRAHEELPALVQHYASQMGVSYHRLFIKHNSSNWGSCSVRRNINLNLNLMRLPSDLRTYVILHELCHLVHMNHGPRFHALLQSCCSTYIAPDADERILSRRLKRYMLI